MKEGMSYTFLMNIIFTFIFICFAIIMGIVSYYKAFRANTIITSTIEKYEGYNCASISEIDRKLQSISYNVPFNVSCKSGDGNCIVDPDGNYKITAYNLDGPTTGTKVGPKSGEKYAYITQTGSIYYYNNETETSTQTKNYQYGVTTYMYIDTPVVNKLLKLSFFSKTDIMYEFRDISKNSDNFYDANFRTKKRGANIINLQQEAASAYMAASTGNTSLTIFNPNDPEYNSRIRLKLDIDNDGMIDATDASTIGQVYENLSSHYRNCEDVRSFDNY